MKESLCQYCRNITCLGCSWARNFKPVKGWTAIPKTLRCSNGESGISKVQSYIVTSCPLFDRDWQKVTQKEVAKAFGKATNTVSKANGYYEDLYQKKYGKKGVRLVFGKEG